MLLLKDNGLVKSIKFKKHAYIGDPINAVRIFNAKKADEIVFLDIDASNKKRLVSLDFVRKVGDEANMPFAVGGGIRTLYDIKQIINQGAEKVILGTIACENPGFVKAASEEFGSSTVSVCIDVKRNYFGKAKVRYFNGERSLSMNLVEYAQLLERLGAGEIIIQSIDNDGMYNGYDLLSIKAVTENTTIPVVALGGACGVSDFQRAFFESKASALAAGSIFVYQAKGKGILINYPSAPDFEKE